MKRASVTCRNRCLAIVAVFWLAACWILPSGAWAVDSSGLIFSIHTDKNQYKPGQDVKLTMVLKKDETDTQPIITKRGFSDSKNLVLHRFLSITVGDPPNTTTYHLGGVPQAHTMEPADYEDEEDETVVEWRFAEILGDQIPITEKIKNLLELTSSVVDEAADIQNMTGWFTLRAVITAYVRFDPQQTRSHYVLGTLGKIGAAENYTEPIESNTLLFFVKPDQGARFEVQVLDQGVPAPGVPVKVFRSDQIPPDVDPLELWSGLPEAPLVLTGTTDLINGTVTQWENGANCLEEDDYKVVAYHGGTFGQAAIYDGDEKWLPSCAGKIERTILFGKMSPAENFSLFGLNSVRIGKRAVVLSGDVGANAAVSESKSKSKSKSKGSKDAVVYIGGDAELRPGTRIFGDSVRIEKKAVVYDVYYNELENNGKILGEKITPLELPVWEPPVFVESAPGDEKIKVKGKKGKKGNDERDPVELAAGAYDEVKIEHKGELHLLGGTYHFRRLELKKGTSLICRGPATILIEEDLESDDKSYIGPDAGAGIGAANIVIHVGGINGKKKKSKVKKVVIGKKSRVIANIYAPHSTLVIERECQAEGSFIAAEVVIEDKATVAYNGAF